MPIFNLAFGIEDNYTISRDDPKKRDEMIERLKPAVYQPIMTWAVRTRNFVKGMASEEISHLNSPPPFLDDNIDFHSIVGKTLKEKYSKSYSLFHGLDHAGMAARSEYTDRLKLLVHKHGYADDVNQVKLLIDGQGYDTVSNAIFMYGLRYVTDRVTPTAQILLSYNAPPRGWVSSKCDEDVLSAILHPETLAEFPKFKNLRTELTSSLDDLIGYLSGVIRVGEKDWNL